GAARRGAAAAAPGRAGKARAAGAGGGAREARAFPLALPFTCALLFLLLPLALLLVPPRLFLLLGLVDGIGGEPLGLSRGIQGGGVVASLQGPARLGERRATGAPTNDDSVFSGPPLGTLNHPGRIPDGPPRALGRRQLALEHGGLVDRVVLEALALRLERDPIPVGPVERITRRLERAAQGFDGVDGTGGLLAVGDAIARGAHHQLPSPR